MSLFVVASCVKRNVAGGGSPDYHVPTVPSTINDDGYYNGFPMGHQLGDGTIISIYKKASGHAPKGPLTLARSTNGGAAWTESQVIISGVSMETASLGLGVLPSGRLLLANQDDELYTSLKFAYSDNKGVSWTAGSTFNFPGGFTSSASPVKMIVMPSGKIFCGYYKASNTSGGVYEIGFLQSVDNGVSFSQGPIIFQHTAEYPNNFGSWIGHEFAFVITHNSGVDATCKMIAVVRVAVEQEGGTYAMHYKSIDGGVSWTTDLTADTATYVRDGVSETNSYSRHLVWKPNPANHPFDLLVHGGLVYLLVGERSQAGGYKLKYIAATPDGAFQNMITNWTNPVALVTFNAQTLGSSTDCGYPVMFEDYQGKLWAQYYDVSTQVQNPVITTRRCWVKQIKIVD